MPIGLRGKQERKARTYLYTEISRRRLFHSLRIKVDANDIVLEVDYSG